MGRIRKTLALMLTLIILMSGQTFLMVMAQAPTSTAVSTLGPLAFQYYTPNNQTIIYSPINGENYSNPVTLNLSVTSTALLGQFGNIGYSLDGGTINSISSFTNKSLDSNQTSALWYFYNTTVFADVIMPQLSEGIHNITVYYGSQYQGIPENPSLQRFEVYSFATANFTVLEISANSPNASTSIPSEDKNPPHLDPIVYLIPVSAIIVVIASILIYRRHRKTADLKQ